jgi:hypothetical protein
METDGRSFSLAYIVELIAKYGTAIGLVSLGTAFLYDSIYWSMIDQRLLSLFVISDHIQTAVTMMVSIAVVGVVTLVSYILMIAAGHWLTRFPHYVVTWLLVLIVAAGIYWMLMIDSRVLRLLQSPSPDIGLTIQNLAISAVVGTATIALIFRFSQRLPNLHPRIVEWLKRDRRRLIPIALLVLWVAVTCIGAMMYGRWASIGMTFHDRPDTIDVVTMEKGTASGKVLRVIDRGTIMRLPSDGRIKFIPKEQIRGVEYGVPKNLVF